MSLTGFRVVKNVLNQEVSNQDLGGAEVHANLSGVGHFRHQNEAQCFRHLRDLVSMLPQHNQDKRPFTILTGVDKDQYEIGHLLPSSVIGRMTFAG